MNQGRDRTQHYESATRLLRWGSIGLVVATARYAGLQAVTVYSVAALAVIYNCLRYSTTLLKHPVFASSAFSLSVDHAMAFVLILATGGLGSPYIPLLYILMIAAAYDLSLNGLVIIGGLQWILVLLAWTFTGGPPQDIALVGGFSSLTGFLTYAWTSVEHEQHLSEMSAKITAEAERQRLMTLINSLTDAVLEIDAGGRIRLYNGAALELLNTNRDIAGQFADELIRLQDEHQQPVELIEMLRTLSRPQTRRDLALPADDGTLLDLEINVSPVISNNLTRSQGWIMVMTDITKQKSIEEERDEFISVVSHELRTPVAIAEANLSTALLPEYAKIEPKAMQLLDQAHQNIVFLGLLIKDLSTLAKAERRDQKVQLEAVSIPELFSEIDANYRSQAKDKGLGWSVETAPGLGDTLSSRYVLAEILQNFISNAIKYTQKGGVTVSATLSDGRIRLAVHDTGIGIAAGDKKHMFEKFYRAEDFRTRQTAGTGLGLYITRKLAGRIGARIDFESRLNSGSTFWIELPLVPVEAPVPQPA